MQQCAFDYYEPASPTSDSDEYCTPPEYIDIARRVLGTIDVDPASNKDAQRYIQAQVYYTKEINGLQYDWPGRVWLNPPYSAGNVDAFVAKLIQQYESGITTEAILLVNSSTETDWFQSLKRYPVCFKRRRISFLLGGVPQTSNLYKQAFFYLGPNWDRFKRVFEPIGAVYYPA